MKRSIVRVDTSSNIASRITIVVIAVLKFVHCFVFSGFGEDSVNDMKTILNHSYVNFWPRYEIQLNLS